MCKGSVTKESRLLQDLNQDRVPTFYWLPKLHKNPYKARFIANSSSCTTTELSKLLTSCLTAVKNMLSSTVKGYMRDPVKTYLVY